MENFKDVETKYALYLEKRNKSYLLSKSKDLSKLMESLAKRLGFTADEVVVSQIIGLLLNVGRVEKEVNKLKEKDTQLVAIDYLFKNQNHIADFLYEKDYDDYIRNAIYYSNKDYLPKDKDPVTIKFIKLTQDATILFSFYEKGTNEELVFDGNVSGEVKEVFDKEQNIPENLVVTSSDQILCDLSQIFLLHYEESIDLLVENDYLGLYLGMIEVSKDNEEEYQKYVDQIYAKVKRGI